MTAIEWLIIQIKNDQNQKALSAKEWLEVIEQAKEMQKQEIITAYAFGHNDGCRYMTNEKQEFEHGEAYFAETFKQD